MRRGGLLLAGLACFAAPSLAASPPVTVVAHRGLSQGMPENTLAAFRRAAERGVRVIEVDLRTTKDGQIVLLHDATLDRTTDCSGPVSGLMLLRLGKCDAGTGERVPTFAEALGFIKTVPARLLLDIKPGTPLEDVIRQVREQHAEGRVIFGLRRAKDIARVRAELPAATTLAFMADAASADKHAAAGAHILRLWSDWVEADPAIVARTRALGPDVWIMVGRRLPGSKRQWQELHSRMTASGGQGIITDRPDLVEQAP